MTELSPMMAEALGEDATSLCHAWKLVLADGTAMGFTDHDCGFALDGLDYEPESGLSPSETRESVGLAVDTAEVSGALTSERIREDDLLAGRFDGATLETFLVDWTNPVANLLLRKATIGRVARSDGLFTAELDSFSRGYDLPGGRYFRRDCDAEVGDGKCGVPLNADAFTASATVTGIEPGDRVVVEGLEPFEAGWFAGGVATFATAGRRRVIAHIRSDGTDWLTLATGPDAVAVGEGVSITAGCDKTFATCAAKFANAVNFRGFPHLPGNDAAYAYAGEGGTFDGSPLVP